MNRTNPPPETINLLINLIFVHFANSSNEKASCSVSVSPSTNKLLNKISQYRHITRDRSRVRFSGNKFLFDFVHFKGQEPFFSFFNLNLR